NGEQSEVAQCFNTFGHMPSGPGDFVMLSLSSFSSTILSVSLIVVRDSWSLAGRFTFGKGVGASVLKIFENELARLLAATELSAITSPFEFLRTGSLIGPDRLDLTYLKKLLGSLLSEIRF